MIHNCIVVGGGIGGCSMAALLHARGHEVVLLEKEPSLGGCASTFIHKNNRYNAGATTVSGYHDEGIVRRLCDEIGVELPLIHSEPSITILQGDRSCIRYRDLESFIREIETFYPHPKHREFWTLVHSLQEQFYTMQGHYYSNRSWFKKLCSLGSFVPILKTFKGYLFSNARTFIQKFYGDITPEYLDFLDAQLLIVAQAKAEKISFFTAALSLSYTFNETHYPLGGMGAVCEALTSKLPDIRTHCTVHSILRKNDHYLLTTSQGTLECKNLILGTSLYESGKWFEDTQIQNYFDSYKKLDNHQSAFVLYMSIRSSQIFHHHYQLVGTSILPYTISKSLFVSFSDPSDTLMAPHGEYRVTASIHTDARLWIGLSPALYRTRKKELQQLLQGWICGTLSIHNDQVQESFAATPKTFQRYLGRSQLGGNALTRSNLLPNLPANDTPFQGLYHVGDTTYAAQGWPGVMMGVFNCMRLIHG